MIAHMAYVVCDGCGLPASQPMQDGKDARLAIPRDWHRKPVAPGMPQKLDLCPLCYEASR